MIFDFNNVIDGRPKMDSMNLMIIYSVPAIGTKLSKAVYRTPLPVRVSNDDFSLSFSHHPTGPPIE
ncbi:MAG: hypothetical protein ACI8T1_001713 [Verrucomicrobiales bacterium]|jgi:hypothetical protein